MFEQVDASRASPFSAWSPIVAAVGAAAFTAPLANHFLSPESDSLVSAIVQSATAVLIVFAASAGAGLLAFCFAHPISGKKAVSASASLAGLAVWLLPLVLTAWDGAIWVALISGGFSMAAATTIGRYQRLFVGDLEPGHDRSPCRENEGLFSALGVSGHSPLKGIPVACAASLQVGVTALAFGVSNAATVAFAAAGVLLVWAASIAFGPRGEARFRARESITSVAAAIALMAVIGRYGEPPLYPGGNGNGSAQGRQRQARANRNMHSSVILKNATKPHVVIIAPRLKTPHNRRSLVPRKPMGIPFSGEYWFVPWPRHRPSKNSMVQWGSPMEWVFTNEDRQPLQMVARQHLGAPLSISCCSHVEVALSAQPSESETVGIGLFLVRTREKRSSVSQSLGLRELREIAVRGGALDDGRVRGKLRFAIPEERRIEAFDEIHVLFHLRSPRMFRSAKVEVQSFTLIP